MNQFEERYELQDWIGEGASCAVHVGLKKDDHQEVAVKIIANSVLKANPDLMREIQILENLDHPNIVKLVETQQTPEKLYIVMELICGMPLFDAILEENNFTEDKAKKMVEKLFGAINYLHHHSIAHRDLKPENIIFSSMEENAEPKILDFGASIVLENDEGERIESCPDVREDFDAVGTLGYKPPEMVKGEHSNSGTKVDCWAMGVITYIILCGFPPFFSDPRDKDDQDYICNAPFWLFFNSATDELKKQICEADFDFPEHFWGEVPEQAKDFVKKLIVVDHKERMSAEQALSHPWIQPPKSFKRGRSRLFTQQVMERQETMSGNILTLAMKEMHEGKGVRQSLIETQKGTQHRNEQQPQQLQQDDLSLSGSNGVWRGQSMSSLVGVGGGLGTQSEGSNQLMEGRKRSMTKADSTLLLDSGRSSLRIAQRKWTNSLMTTVSVALPGGLEDFARMSQKIDEEEQKEEEEEERRSSPTPRARTRRRRDTLVFKKIATPRGKLNLTPRKKGSITPRESSPTNANRSHSPNNRAPSPRKTSNSSNNSRTSPRPSSSSSSSPSNQVQNNRGPSPTPSSSSPTPLSHSSSPPVSDSSPRKPRPSLPRQQNLPGNLSFTSSNPKSPPSPTPFSSSSPDPSTSSPSRPSSPTPSPIPPVSLTPVSKSPSKSSSKGNRKASVPLTLSPRSISKSLTKSNKVSSSSSTSKSPSKKSKSPPPPKSPSKPYSKSPKKSRRRPSSPFTMCHQPSSPAHPASPTPSPGPPVICPPSTPEKSSSPSNDLSGASKGSFKSPSKSSSKSSSKASKSPSKSRSKKLASRSFGDGSSSSSSVPPLPPSPKLKSHDGLSKAKKKEDLKEEKAKKKEEKKEEKAKKKEEKKEEKEEKAKKKEILKENPF